MGYQPVLVDELFAYKPLSIRGGDTVESSVTWEDIGGLQDAKILLKDTIETPNRYFFLFENYPLKMRSGVLLYGPPGCGKTLLA
jgi:peroxin-1